MADTPYKFAATAENFMTDVVEASQAAPVLVDFWAPWCGPCQALTPVLERIADDYAGRFLLAKVNTDEQQQLATHFQVRSIPMVMLVHKGEVVEQFVGVQPESSIKAMLDKYLDAQGEPGSPPAPVSNAEEGMSQRAELAPQTVENSRPEDLAMAALEQRDVAAATEAVEALATTNAEHPLLGALRARLAFVETANAHPDVNALRTALAADPANVAVRHALAAHYALVGDYGTALAEWLEVMRRDRKFGDDLGRRTLMQAFDVLGEQDPLVIQYRRRVASLLH
jgi:putative thioredoxin